MPFFHLKDLLPKALRVAKVHDQVQAAQALEACQKVVEQVVPAAAGRARLLHIRLGVLTVQSDSPAMAQELRLREGEILRRMRERSLVPVEHLRYQLAESPY